MPMVLDAFLSTVTLPFASNILNTCLLTVSLLSFFKLHLPPSKVRESERQLLQNLFRDLFVPLGSNGACH